MEQSKEKEVVLGIDIWGTLTKIGLVDRGGNIKQF